MEFIEEKVKEGKFLAALSLEDKVLANGILPNSPIFERFSLVKGILTGLLEKGQWEKALQLVYQEGSPARVLFDGDWEGFKREVLQTVERRKRDYLSESVEKLLYHHHEEEFLYDIAVSLSLREEEMERIIEGTGDKVPQPKITTYYHQQASKMKEEGELHKAYAYFHKVGDERGIEDVYQQLLTNPRDFEDIDLLLTIASTNDSLTRLPPAVRMVLDNPRWMKSDGSLAKRLYHLLQEHKNTPVTDEENERIRDAMVETIEHYRLEGARYSAAEQIHDPDLRLRWAKKKAREYPSLAYSLFREQHYEGPEVLRAAQEGLLKHTKSHNDARALSPSMIREEHLRELYSQVSPELQVTIASHLRDKELLITLSREFYARGKLDDAYRLWIRGKGDTDDPWVVSIRETIIREELAKREGHPYFWFLQPTDVPGHIQAYNAVREKFPEEAYKLARRINDVPRLQQAREAIIALSPERALRKFEGSTPEERDQTGIDLALTALAEKYQLPREKVVEYLALKEPSQRREF